MKTYSFTVEGNQENPEGNPLGYHRTTQRAKYSPEHIKYEEWKGHVQYAYSQAGFPFFDILETKPLTTSKSQPAELHIEIEFASDARSDCDNVYKGIADALFKNDKYVMNGSYTGKISPDKVGRVHVKIKI